MTDFATRTASGIFAFALLSAVAAAGFAGQAAAAEVKPGGAAKSGGDHGGPAWTMSLQGSFAFFRPDEAARTAGLRCDGCTNDVDIRNSEPATIETLFNPDVSGRATLGHRWSVFDLTIAAGGHTAETDPKRMQVDDSGAIEEIGTPYGICNDGDDDICESEDKAHFINGDLEMGFNGQTGRVHYRLFGGLRGEVFDWTRISEHHLEGGEFEGTENSTFVGAGPRIGAHSEIALGKNQFFHVVTGVSGGVLVGSLKREFDAWDADIPGPVPFDESNAVAVPFGEAEMGLGLRMMENVFVQLGYEGGYRGGVISSFAPCTDTLNDDLLVQGDASCGRNERSGMWTHGAFVRLGGEF